MTEDKLIDESTGEEIIPEDSDPIDIIEDPAMLESESVIIDDGSDIQNEPLYQDIKEYQETFNTAKEDLKQILIKIITAGEITQSDKAELDLAKDKYNESYNTISGTSTKEKELTLQEQINDIKNTMLTKDQASILDALTAGGVKSWVYTDESGNVQVDGLHIPALSATYAEIENLKVKDAEIENAVINKAEIEDLKATNAEIENLKVKDAEIDNAIINKADIDDLNAANANIGILTGQVANINTLIGGNLTMDNMQSLVLTSDKVTVQDAFIKNAMIDSVSVNKLMAGSIDTNKIRLSSNDGSMTLTGSLQQFKDDAGNVRIQMGKDASGSFSFALFDASGTGTLIDESGIKAAAIGDKIIVNDMIDDNAAISGSKLDINSVVTEINDGTTTIKGSIVKLDDKNQTLDVAFNNLSTKVEDINTATGDIAGLKETVTSNTTAIGIAQGKIDTLISNTTITKEDGSTVQMKDDYSAFKQTVDGISNKVGSLETNYKRTLKSTKMQYYVSTSSSTPTGGSWIDTTPTWTTGKYIWQRLVYMYTDDSVVNGTAVCIQGAKGDTGATGTAGADGKGLVSSTPQYCAHTSSTTAPTSGFIDTCPAYVAGKFLWIRFKQIWSNPSDTTYTNAYYDASWDAKNTADTASKTVTSKVSEFQQNLDGFKATVSSTYQTKDAMKDYSTTTQMNSAISQSASKITSTVSSTYATKSDLSGQVTTLNNAISTASQKADRFDWIVKSSSTSSNLSLTDATISAIAASNIKLKAPQITLEGYTTINSGFKVDTAGNMEAVNGKFAGTITGSTIKSAAVNESNMPLFSMSPTGEIVGATVDCKSLTADGSISSETLNVDVINNSRYPQALDESLDVYLTPGATSATDWFDGAVYANMDDLYDAVPRNLNGYTIKIYLTADYPGNINLNRFHSGHCYLMLQRHTVKGYIYANGPSMRYAIYGNTNSSTGGTANLGNIKPGVGKTNSDYKYSLYFEYTRITLYDVNVYAASQTGASNSGILVTNMTSAYMSNINAYNNPVHLLRTHASSHVYVASSSGLTKGNTFSAVSGSTQHLNKTKQAGCGTSGTNPYYTSGNAQIFRDGVTFATSGNSGTNDTKPPAETVETHTVTLKATSGNTYRRTVYNNWKNDGTVRQGDWGYGDCDGFWFFGSQLSNYRSKNITKVQITIKRNSGGIYGDVSHKIVGHNYTSKPSGTPEAMGSTIATVSLAVGESKTITLSSSQIATFKKYKGIGLKNTYGSGYYSVCSATCTVKITYKE